MSSRVCASVSGEQNGQGESGHSTSRAWSGGRGPARSLRSAVAAPPESAGQGEGAEPMSSLTAWRFSGTEEADDAVLRLKRLNEQDLIDVQDVAVIRWPQYAAAPMAHEHVIREGGMVSSFAKKLSHSNIDSSAVESVKGDLTPGTSALVLLSANATVDTVAKAFEG